MRTIILTGALLLAACAKTEPAEVTFGDNIETPATALPGEIAAATDDPTTPGSWDAAGAAGAQSVTYRGPEGEMLFSISCDLRGGLVVQRPGLVARGNLALMQLRTADVVRRLAVNAGAGEQPQVEARIPYNDQLISALMAFNEPLEVRYESLDTLVLPPSPMVGDLVRTCQQTTGGATADVPTGTDNAAAPAPDAAAGNQAQPAGTQQ